MLAFLNGLEYHISDFKILNGNNLATFCVNFIMFAAVSPEIMRVETNFWDDTLNWHIPPNISECTRPIFQNFQCWETYGWQ